jgi:hypothetical protein
LKEEKEEEEPGLTDTRIIEALERNAKIDPLSVCPHPLAVLAFEPLSFFIRRNYLKKGEEVLSRKQIQLWWEAGVVEKAPQEAKCNFALLMVPKKDENGVVVDKRLCLDLSPINNKLSVDHYPIPNLFECLKIGGKFKGEVSRRSVVDYTSSFTRFVCRNNIACFEFEGTRYTFTRAMFGSRNMPAIFQRVIDAIILESGLHTKEVCIVNTVKFIEISTKYKLIINQKKVNL